MGNDGGPKMVFGFKPNQWHDTSVPWAILVIPSMTHWKKK